MIFLVFCWLPPRIFQGFPGQFPAISSWFSSYLAGYPLGFFKDPPSDFLTILLANPPGFSQGFLLLSSKEAQGSSKNVRGIPVKDLRIIWGCQHTRKKVQKKLSESSWGGSIGAKERGRTKKHMHHFRPPLSGNNVFFCSMLFSHSFWH